MPDYTKYFAIGVAGDLLADLIVTKEAREVKIITDVNEYEAYIVDLDWHFEGKLRDMRRPFVTPELRTCVTTVYIVSVVYFLSFML